MKKIAIFVEGQAELIFVREYLLKRFDYQISLLCQKLLYNERFDNVNYSIDNPDACFHFTIIDVGGDTSVLKNILKHELLLWNSGFDRIVGLRDMFSLEYKKIIKQPPQIKEEVNLNFIKTAKNIIQTHAKRPTQIYFHFAIMELEAWFLGIPKLWERKGLSSQNINEKLKLELSEIDPETTFLHPAETIKDILEIINQNYRKQAGEVESLMGYIEKQDFEDLHNSQKCNSFKEFTSSLAIT
jgi:hypothetical protein